MKQWLLSMKNNRMKYILILCVAIQIICTVLCLASYAQTRRQTDQIISDYSVQLTEAISSEFRRNNTYLQATVFDSFFRKMFSYTNLEWVNCVSQLQDMYKLCNSQSRFDYYFFTMDIATGRFLEAVAVREPFEAYLPIKTALMNELTSPTENGVYRLLSVENGKRIIYTTWQYGNFLCGCWITEETFGSSERIQGLPISYTICINPGHEAENSLHLTGTDFSVSLQATGYSLLLRPTVLTLIQAVLSAVVVISLSVVTNTVNKKLLLPAWELTGILEKYTLDSRHGGSAAWSSVMDDAAVVLERLGMQVESLNLKLAEAELDKQKLNLSFRNLQIRPHFLVNSLAMINGMARCGELEKIKAITVRLSDYYRYVLRDITECVPVELELTHLKNLIEVTQQWNGNTIQAQFCIEPEVEGEQIPVLLISTFVENSIKHAQSPTGELEIQILCRRQGKDKLNIEILDNGSGFPQELIDDAGKTEPVNGQHIGIYNCVRRLELLYGSQASVRLFNRDCGGAGVTILIPREDNYDASHC